MQTLKVHESNIRKSKVLNVYTIAAASHTLNVTTTTIRNWIEQGRLSEVSIAGGDIRLIDGKSVENMKAKLESNPVKRGQKGN